MALTRFWTWLSSRVLPSPDLMVSMWFEVLEYQLLMVTLSVESRRVSSRLLPLRWNHMSLAEMSWPKRRVSLPDISMMVSRPSPTLNR